MNGILKQILQGFLAVSILILPLSASPLPEEANAEGEVLHQVNQESQTADRPSNLEINYEDMKDFTLAQEFVAYFTAALEEMEDLPFHDPEKKDLTEGMETAISLFSTVTVQGIEDHANLTAELLTPSVEQSIHLYNEFLALLLEYKIDLNRDVTPSIPVFLADVTPTSWSITLNQDLTHRLFGNDLLIFLDQGQRGITITHDNLVALLTEYESLHIKVDQINLSQHNITFYGGYGEYLSKLETPIRLFYPCDQEDTTVFYQNQGEFQIWGGQIQDGTIQFQTAYSGIYAIDEHPISLSDVSPSHKNVVQSMVTQGIFTLDEQGNFLPDQPMTRYDYTKAIVSLLFALDFDASTYLPDIPQDHEHYDAIASAISQGIMSEFGNSLFQGDMILTEEMVFTLMAQVLVQQRGYDYPEEYEAYLSYLSEETTYNAWAERGIAMCLREGIATAQEITAPKEPLTREKAAVFFSRLFLLLEEKPQLNLDLIQEFEPIPPPIQDKLSPFMLLLIIATLAASVYFVYSRIQRLWKPETD